MIFPGNEGVESEKKIVHALHLSKYTISDSHSNPMRQALFPLFFEEETQVQGKLRNLFKIKASIW